MKRKVKWKNVIILNIILILVTIFIITLINIIKWKIDSKNTNNEIKNIEEKAIIKKVKDTKKTEIIKQDEIEKSNPYWKYIKMNLIDVDFKELKNINDQTKGWIQVNGTNINYPFVQANDNSYYLTHSFDKSYNGAGWIFLDYRNKLDGNDKNIIIYGHRRSDKTMFGSLKNILNNSWLNDYNNHIVKLSTEHENTLWQVFSVYYIPATSDYIKTNFSNEDDFINFGNMLKERSIHNFNATINHNDKILTLSTCYNTTNRVVLHAKLIKREFR